MGERIRATFGRRDKLQKIAPHPLNPGNQEIPVIGEKPFLSGQQCYSYATACFAAFFSAALRNTSGALKVPSIA